MKNLIVQQKSTNAKIVTKSTAVRCGLTSQELRARIYFLSGFSVRGFFSCPELRDELSACQHFLTDTEMENGRHKVFILHLSKLDPDLVNEKLDRVYEKLDCAAKIEKYEDCFKEYRGSDAA